MSGLAASLTGKATSGASGTEKVDLSNPDFAGYLTKRSAWLKEWRKRYFVLKGNKLYFTKGPGDDPHGKVDLQECLTVKSAEDKTNKPHSFEVATPDATYYMFADSEKEKDEWISAIGRAIVRFSSAYMTDDGYDAPPE